MALFDHQYRITEFFKSETDCKHSQKRHRSALWRSPLTIIPPLQKMPPEIRFLILKSMPDLDTLLTAAGSSPCLWRLYAPHKEIINECVLRNEIGPAVFPLAIAADWQLREQAGVVSIVDNHLQTALDFAETYVKNSAYTEGPVLKPGLFERYHFFGTENAFVVSRYHGKVDYLARRCATRLQAEANQTPLASAAPVSVTEISRYQRAIYIYDVIGTLFNSIRHFDDFDVDFDEEDPDSMTPLLRFYNEAWLPLWDHFAPWEFLQVKAAMKCLCDIIVEQMAAEIPGRLEGPAAALRDHILNGEDLPRDVFELVSPTTWSFQSDGLLPILHATNMDFLYSYLKGKTTLQSTLEDLLEGLAERYEESLWDLTTFWKDSLFGPWLACQTDRWEPVLFGVTEGMPFYKWEELENDQCCEPWERKMWTWLWILGFGDVGLYPEIEDDYIDLWRTTSLRGATLFWDEMRWNQLTSLPIPDMTLMEDYIYFLMDVLVDGMDGMEGLLHGE